MQNKTQTQRQACKQCPQEMPTISFSSFFDKRRETVLCRAFLLTIKSKNLLMFTCSVPSYAFTVELSSSGLSEKNKTLLKRKIVCLSLVPCYAHSRISFMEPISTVGQEHSNENYRHQPCIQSRAPVVKLGVSSVRDDN